MLKTKLIRRVAFLFLSLLCIFIYETPIESAVTGDGNLFLYNIHTQEISKITYRQKNIYISKALKEINWLLRCYYTNTIKEINLKLLEILDEIQDHFGGDKKIIIISGYRSSLLNKILRTRSRGVAQNSRHLYGQAIDFRLEDVPLFDLVHYASQIHCGGIGVYPGSNFIHIDVGPARIWPAKLAQQIKAKVKVET